MGGEGTGVLIGGGKGQGRFKREQGRVQREQGRLLWRGGGGAG